MDRTLEDVINEQCYFEDSALEDAIAYAQKITTNSEKLKKEKQDGQYRKENTR
jgi:hypothetical protein